MRTLLPLLLAAACVSAPPLRPVVYHDAACFFTISLPAGWAVEARGGSCSVAILPRNWEKYIATTPWEQELPPIVLKVFDAPYSSKALKEMGLMCDLVPEPFVCKNWRGVMGTLWHRGFAKDPGALPSGEDFRYGAGMSRLVVRSDEGRDARAVGVTFDYGTPDWPNREELVRTVLDGLTCDENVTPGRTPP